MATKKQIFIRMNGLSDSPYESTIPYFIHKEEGYCIIHRCKRWIFIDIDTGIGFGRSFKSQKEAKEFTESPEFKDYLDSLENVRKRDSYKERKTDKYLYLRHWQVEDVL